MDPKEGSNDNDRVGGGETRATERKTAGWRMLAATVVSYDDQPDECTIHPPEPTDSERTTAWITAKEGTYVSAVAWR